MFYKIITCKGTQWCLRVKKKREAIIIIVGNKIGNPSSNPEWGCLNLTTLWCLHLKKKKKKSQCFNELILICISVKFSGFIDMNIT